MASDGCSPAATPSSSTISEALRDLGVGAIDFDFERPDEEAVIAAMRAFRERVLARV
jgi:hypothetical protein